VPAQIVFLTLFLGLVSGTQPIAMQVSGPVKLVRLYLDGKEVAAVHAPWRTVVELGNELTPREMTAVGFDADGDEVARATQVLNLPRPQAEFDVVVGRDTLALHWRHLMNLAPKRALVTLDGKPLALDARLRAKLPKLDPQVPHIVSAELHFEDGFLARRELVIESARSSSVGTELTPVLVRETAKKHPATWDGCLALPSGKSVRTAAVEKPPALLIIVKDPDAAEVTQPLRMYLRGGVALDSPTRRTMALDPDTYMRILWPVSKRYVGSDSAASVLFEPSEDVSASKSGLLPMLLGGYVGESADSPRQFVDATAVAGVRAITGSWRRAVVVLLSASADASKHDARVVRRYLQSVGVPLFVWSVTGPRPELADAWGEIEDVSDLGRLAQATKKIRDTLAEQRIAWVDVDPLRGLQLKAKERCGIATVAQPAP
jgi:hypothetical protein